MRIAQLIDSLTVGGAQKLQVLFAHALRDLNVDLTVATLFPSQFGALVAELESLGVRVRTFHGRSVVDPLRAARLVRFLSSGRFDILFTHLTSANILGPLAGRIIGVPTIATLHSISDNYRSRIKTLESWTLRRAATCRVAVGPAVAATYHQRQGGARCVVIPNPVTQTAPLPPAERLEIRHELIGTKSVMLASVGMLLPVKGFGDLLAAFADLRRTHPEAGLVIAGAGPLEEELHAHIDALGLRGHAHLIGLREDVPRLLAAADAYVCSSNREGLPLSLLEAMEAGLPVVATDVGDVRSVVVDGTGLVVPAGEPVALAEALRTLLDDTARARAIGATARRHVHQSYSVDKWAERLLQLAAEVCGHTDRLPFGADPRTHI